MNITKKILLLALVVLQAAFAARDPENIVIQTPDNADQFYLEPNQTSVIRLLTPKLENGVRVPYDILGYDGTTVLGRGHLTVKNKQLELTVILPTGYYELRFPMQDITLGISVLNPFKKQIDPFFSMEALISSQSNKKQRLSDIRVLKRAGITSIREWTGFVGIQPTKYQKTRTYPTAPDERFQEFADGGIKAIFCTNDFPSFYYPEGKFDFGPRRPPLRHVYPLVEAVQSILNRRRPGLEAFHILNEYDLCQYPADLQLPPIKAAAYAMKDDPLLFAAAPFAGPNHDSVVASIANGLLDYTDAFCFHTYGEPESIENLVTYFRDKMKNHPKAAMPMWLTECGKPWSRGIKPEELKSTWGGPLGNLHPTPAEDSLSALWIAMKGVESKATGVAKYYPFVFIYFQETVNNFGMRDYHRTPLRSLHDYFVLVQELAGKTYSGDLAEKPKELSRARLFTDNHNATLVIYTNSTQAGITTVKLPKVSILAARNIDGSPAQFSQDGSVTFYGGMAYVDIPVAQMKAVSQQDTPAFKLLQQAQSYAAIPRVTSPIVYQFDAWGNIKREGAHYLAEGTFEYPVYIMNLSNQPVKIAPELQLPDGAELIHAHENPHVVPPKGELHLVWKVNVDKVKQTFYPIRIVDKLNPNAYLDTTFMTRGHLEKRDFNAMMDPKRWRTNSSGKTYITFDENELALHFRTDFTGVSNRWVFPEFVLDLPKESLRDLVSIEFEMKMTQSGGAAGMSSNIVMFCTTTAHGTAPYDNAPYAKPQDSWKKVSVTVPRTRSGEYKMLRIGMCPGGDDVDYAIRNVKLLFNAAP